MSVHASTRLGLHSQDPCSCRSLQHRDVEQEVTSNEFQVIDCNAPMRDQNDRDNHEQCQYCCTIHPNQDDRMADASFE